MKKVIQFYDIYETKESSNKHQIILWLYIITQNEI